MSFENCFMLKKTKKKNQKPGSLRFCRRALLDGVGFVFPPFLLVIRQTLPAKGQAPVEVASVVVLAVRRRFDEFESVEVDGGYVGTHHDGAVPGDPGQQRLQPPVEAFACGNRCCVNTAASTWLKGGCSHAKVKGKQSRAGEGGRAGGGCGSGVCELARTYSGRRGR